MSRSRKKTNDWAYETVYGPFLSLGGIEGKGRAAVNPSAEREMLMERMYRRVLTEMAMNRFKWEGFPDSVDLRYLELTLFNYALSVCYYDKTYGKLLALQGMGAGTPNFYKNPTTYTINGNGSFLSKTLPAREVVPIWSNYLRIPDIDIVLIYSRKLAELDRTIEINSHNARQARILAANENTRLSVENINRQIDNGDNLIMINSNGPFGEVPDLNQIITVLNMGVEPDAIEKLHILRTRLWGECMGLLGIDFANQDKKERLVAAEVGANNEQIDAIKRVNLNARQIAADQINKKFNLNVTVDYQTSSATQESLMNLNPSEMDDH